MRDLKGSPLNEEYLEGEYGDDFEELEIAEEIDEDFKFQPSTDEELTQGTEAQRAVVFDHVWDQFVEPRNRRLLTWAVFIRKQDPLVPKFGPFNIAHLMYVIHPKIDENCWCFEVFPLNVPAVGSIVPLK